MKSGFDLLLVAVLLAVPVLVLLAVLLAVPVLVLLVAVLVLVLKACLLGCYCLLFQLNYAVFGIEFQIIVVKI